MKKPNPFAKKSKTKKDAGGPVGKGAKAAHKKADARPKK